jgi:16S rRNA (uracil1498-N3)-methyltransferase
VRGVAAWLGELADDGHAGRFVMSTGSAPPLARVVAPAAAGRWLALSGPEGGLTADEEAAAVARGFARISLGRMILRADTAPLAWLAQMAVLLTRSA